MQCTYTKYSSLNTFFFYIDDPPPTFTASAFGSAGALGIILGALLAFSFLFSACFPCDLRYASKRSKAKHTFSYSDRVNVQIYVSLVVTTTLSIPHRCCPFR